MKKKIIYVLFLFLVAWGFTSCESLFQNCKMCKTVTYENGSIINEGTESEYCGADLLTKEATPDVVVGALVTKVECR
jgi:hypothetical protein